MTRTIHIEGSHGELTVDAATGVILQRTTLCFDTECCGQGAYHDILCFDPFAWDDCAREYGETDILYASAIYADGIYERAMDNVTIQRKGDAEPWGMAGEVFLLTDQRVHHA